MLKIVQKQKQEIVPKFAFFDLAYTLCPKYFVSSFYLYYSKKYSKEKYPEILRKDRILGEKLKNNEITYNQINDEVIGILANLIKGETVEKIKEYAKEYIKNDTFYAYVKPVFEYLFSHNFGVFILTSDFDFVIEPLLTKLPQGFKLFTSKMEIKDGFFTGNVDLVHNSHLKLETVRSIEKDISNAFTIAFGDSQGDIPMLEASDLGFFINEKESEYKKLIKHQKIIHINNPNSTDAVQKIISGIEKFIN